MHALARNLAEDIALTQIVRQRGKKIAPVWQPVVQPLGARTASTVIDRQTRWARLRRISYPGPFVLEILSGAVLPMGAMDYV